MTKNELILALSEKYGDQLLEDDLQLAIDLILEEMCDALVYDRGIEIRGFGSFGNRHRQAHTGRNPKTGSAVEIEERLIPFFKPGQDMRSRVATSKA